MAWMPLRFRSAQRDIATDTARFTKVQRVIHDAIGEADREFRGLSRRIDEAREGAGFLYGNEIESQTETASDESDLRGMEITLTRGQARATHLQAQLRELRTIERSLEELQRLEAVLQKEQTAAS